jgi:hypothetical protein
MSMHADIRERVCAQLANPAAGNDAAELSNALRLLAKWRSALIQNTVLQRQGTIVQQGPLQGLDFLPSSAEGCHVAKLLGTYEQPLHPFIEQVVAESYPAILNIGCAEGYYAVGLARRMPGTRVQAYDSNPNAREVCRTLAEKNNVIDRISIGSLFLPEQFADHIATKTLVLCDIEGAEQSLLDPVQAPALRNLDIIVESHECLVPGITQQLIDRFSASHRITLVQDTGQRALVAPPAWFLNLPHLDQLLAVWEWRSGPTPWLVMKSRVLQP